MSEQGALYVYALLPDRNGAADGVTGLDGLPVRLLPVPGTGLAALVHDAPASPYQGDDEQVRRWVGQQSEAVTAVWERTGSLLPTTFNVLVAGGGPGADGAGGERTAEQRLTDWVTEQAPRITEQLDALDGRCELRVEVTLDRTAMPAAGMADTADANADADADENVHVVGAGAGAGAGAGVRDGRLAGRSAGLRRLLAKQQEQHSRQTAERLADSLHAGLRRRLLSVAEDLRDRGRTHRAPQETDVLSAALLVHGDDVDAVGTVLSELRAQQPAVRIRFLGPWPPYSFAEIPGGQGVGSSADRHGP
ncbi:GvpL/GvpF family gas vesicle protein [Streptomyces poonensis]|uniref:Protein gvpL n=1 Tax=Streptomyces poonensis TaxID=68255 RepID=A0A918QE59_9ACTN|nr:GvpL/GvpF family gas vesicle protein [Streptomyces poonensis]GGZ41055.1 protein gvpL [Streptomyces poonensis]GLJ91746.1 protein gvpL [Streptomyces poonensis]